jgi:formylglycine-generating enzyme required for sulfatase activity/N-acetylneuraminic acid mutarotase
LVTLDKEAWGSGQLYGFDVAMGQHSGGSSFGTSWQSPAGETVRVSVPCTNNTLFDLRLIYKPASQTIEAYYDPTGSGLGWTKLDSITVSEMSPGMKATNTFSFAIVPDTFYGPISEGEMWADNFRLASSASFSFTSSMTTNRENHTATLLPNGKVLVTGGNANDGSAYLSSAELYNPGSATWTATGVMVKARACHTATLLTNGKVLVAGGWNATAYLSSVELYDPGTGKWTLTNSMHTARGAHTATLLPNGKVLVAGGTLDGTNALSSTEIYDPTTGAWTTTGSMTTNRADQTATLLPNGKVLVVGGASGYHFRDSIPGAELYDPATGKWTVTGAPNSAYGQGHTATLLANGKVLAVAGGGTASTVTNSAELYNPATGTWTTTGSLTTAPRHSHTATMLPNGQVLVAAGYNFTDYFLASAELYDPATGMWTATGYLNAGREWATATLLPEGEVLITGGKVDSSLDAASAELYSSTAWTATAATLSNPSKPPGGAFQLAFTSNPNGTNTVLTTTNVTLPLANWTVLGVVPEFSPGLFLFTDTQATNNTRRFYRLRSPFLGIPLQVTTVALPNGPNGVAYSQALAASGGQTPYSWTLISGSLPSGLALATNGVISGTPTTNGTKDFTVKVTDALSATATQSLTLTVLTVLGFCSPPNGVTPVTNMVWIPCGTFVMGSPTSEAERGSDETQHTVTLTKGFYMGKYAVTQGEYLALMGSNPSYFTTEDDNGNPIPPDLNRPVEQVSWDDATNYCAQLTQHEQAAGRLPAGWVYRLPTESEREYACRAGTTTAFHYGNALHGGMANFYDYDEYDASVGDIYVSSPAVPWLPRTTAVGSYQPNAWGLYDMHGNVWEWCRDWYGDYPTGSVTDPQGPTSGSNRVGRGGCWYAYGRGCRSAYRDYGLPSSGYDLVGFRVVLAPGQP